MKEDEFDEELNIGNAFMKQFMKNYDGYIMFIIVSSIVSISILSSIYIWESYQVITEFKENPLVYCRDLIFNNLAGN